MTTPNPPAIGDTAWGTELNNYLTNTLKAEADGTQSALAAHVAGAPVTATGSDPHGDRAYALQLMAPFLQNVNGPAGFVQLNAAGAMPLGNWQDLRPATPSFSTGASPTLYPPQYQVTLDGRVRFAGAFVLTTAGYNGQRVFVTALPLNLRPNIAVDLRVSVSQAGSAPAGRPPVITVGTDGSITLNGCATGLASGTIIGLYGCDYPLDAYYSLIQS